MVPKKQDKCRLGRLAIWWTPRPFRARPGSPPASCDPKQSPAVVFSLFVGAAICAIRIDTFHGGPTAGWATEIELKIAAGSLACLWVAATLRGAGGKS